MAQKYKKANIEKEKINLLRFLFDSKERMKGSFDLEKAIGQKYVLYKRCPNALNTELKEMISWVKEEFKNRYQ